LGGFPPANAEIKPKALDAIGADSFTKGDTMNLRDSVIIVTGSATGLGAAIVKQVAGKGARVVINYTKSEKEAHETEAVCDYLGVESLLCKADISSDEDCRRLAAEAMEKWGRIDGLVNNAARSVFANNNDLETLTGQDFMDVYSVNVVGTYQMTRAAAPHMKAQGNGSIVNVSSISALTGAGSSIAYAASKGALNTMTTALSRALAPEIRVNAVLPSAFPSRWWADGLGEEGAKNLFEKFTAQVPLKSVADPESVARTVVWLLEDAGFITGEMIKIDAGMHLLGFQP
jgi:3-oxoacyl-[acyl-carrier protein] reductase